MFKNPGAMFFFHLSGSYYLRGEELLTISINLWPICYLWAHLPFTL